MDSETEEKLREWASQYHNVGFIDSDPIRFPHRYSRQEDIEISGLLTAMLSFGNRMQILKKAEQMDSMMKGEPLRYLLSGRWTDDFGTSDTRSFYRMISYADFCIYIKKLYGVYASGLTLEGALSEYAGNPMEKLCAFLGVSAKSPQKKINMFLRWMVRRGSDVDFGIWKSMSPAELVIPLDTHVCRMAFRLGLTDKLSFSLSNAKRITDALEKVFPGDPCLGDFALFGYGVSHPDI